MKCTKCKKDNIPFWTNPFKKAQYISLEGYGFGLHREWLCKPCSEQLLLWLEDKK